MRIPRSLLLTVVAGAAIVLVAPLAQAASASLAATFAQTSVWSSGYGGAFTIVNRGDAAANGWVVEFDLPAGSSVSSSWDSTRTGSGQHYRFANASWNGTVAAGGSVSFGFNVAGLGTPVNCLLNGAPCAGGPAPSPSSASPSSPGTPPPSTPAPSTPPPSGTIVDVSTAAQLSSAMAAARPGQTIRLAPGTYDGSFIGTAVATGAAPITVTGPRTAVITNPAPAGSGPSCPVPTPGWDPGYGIWIANAAYWRLTGFTVANAKKGVVVDNSPHVTIDGLHVHHIGDEGVHFRRSSSDGVIRNSVVEYTGTAQPAYGEGVYIGSANSNWDCHGNVGGMDRSDRVEVLDNRIGPYVSAEHIDVKEGTSNGLIRGNTFDGTGISGQNSADSWVDVKGTGYLIQGNTGTFVPPGTFANGYETHNPVAGWGCGNVWRDNVSDLGGVGRYAINVTSTSKCAGNLNVVYASNTVSRATTGLTNITVTP
ncbi:cellulose binding domain-containing protein [Dactylosporangium sp. AC04546]|uniref:cellulose binding domain-containing protein n=1 Tax=Dactylosporangium sp. AC04546 TaxID=2862460 RepID=UPI001EDD7A06|nr:cellulose binding domain-containing protein [Dactylosporangium sp. AC04546]WVK86017.1 cellulose binding domain-containing protein [Dactylosporangium sp. AC04546]